MRMRSAVCVFLMFVLLCAPFQAGADTLYLPDSLEVINSLSFAGLKKDKVFFPESVRYIADDAFQDAEFTGTGTTGSYAYYWCVDHGIAWAVEETTAQGKKLDKEENYSGRTIWQRFPQKYYLKATVINNKGDSAALFESNNVEYNIRMTFYIDEVFNKASEQTKLNYIDIQLKGWNGPDEENNSFDSFDKERFDKDLQGYTKVYQADWISTKAYNVKELMYDERGNVAVHYDESLGEYVNTFKHLDLRPNVWEGAVITIDTGTDTLSIYHPGDLQRDYQVYNLLDANNYCAVTRVNKNLIVDANGKPYKKLRVKITASFNNTSRIAFHESVIDNVFVNVVDLD
ncbi:MAG: hypothetical protein IKH57_12900 [Clostridia bacterium]|nr:hypothetical protein [Clostridia bacterium]